MCRLCSYRSLSISPQYQYPCQVYVILLLLGKRDRFLNPQSTYFTTTRDRSSLLVHQHARSCLMHDPFFIHTSNYSLLVLPTMPAVVLCVAPPSTIPTVVLCWFFVSFHLQILTPEGLRPVPHWCS